MKMTNGKDIIEVHDINVVNVWQRYGFEVIKGEIKPLNQGLEEDIEVIKKVSVKPIKKR